MAAGLGLLGSKGVEGQCELCVDGYREDSIGCFWAVHKLEGSRREETMWAYEGNPVVCGAELGTGEVAGFEKFSRSWWMVYLGVVLCWVCWTLELTFRWLGCGRYVEFWSGK